MAELGSSWQTFYAGELQGLYALLVVPLAFLAYRLVAPAEQARAVLPDSTRFVSGLTLLFAFETMLDPIATGPLIRSQLLADSFAATGIPFLFVLLGDLRVLLLTIGVAHPDHTLRQNLTLAFGISLIVPIATGLVYGSARMIWPELHPQMLWMIYELFFFALCVWLGRVWVPDNFASEPARASYLRSVLGYSAAYYALWLAADLLIVLGGLDLGWAVRIVPNQLYYAFWVPFVYLRFFSLRPANAARQARSSSASHASR